MGLVLLGGVLGQFDVEKRVLIDLSLFVLLALEDGEVDALKGNDHVQAGYASVEGVGYQQSWIEIVQGACQDYVAEALATEKSKAYLAGDEGLVDAFVVAFLNGDLCAFKQTISCVSGLFLPSFTCWLAVRLWLFLGRDGDCCHSLLLLSFSR